MPDGAAERPERRFDWRAYRERRRRFREVRDRQRLVAELAEFNRHARRLAADAVAPLTTPAEALAPWARLDAFATARPALQVPRTEIVGAGVPKSTLADWFPTGEPGKHGGSVALGELAKKLAHWTPRRRDTSQVCAQLLAWATSLEASES